MKRVLLAVVVTALLAPTHAVSAPLVEPRAAVQADGPDHLVHAGTVDPTDPTGIYQYEAYFPRQLSVHKGDWVRWEFPDQGNGAVAFHTVTFGNPDEITYARGDEVPGTLAFDEESFFSSGCGRTGLPVCRISSPGQVVSSGTPILHNSGPGKVHPFDAIVDLPQGTYSYFCALHHPLMQGTIQVVDDDVALNNRKPQDFVAEITAATVEAKKQFAEISDKPKLEIEEGGRRVWTIAAGARSNTTGIPVVAEEFLPSAARPIEPGDTVRWVMGGTAHTVTFPEARGPAHITLNCEFDGAATGAPGVPGIGVGGIVPGMSACPPGGSIEMGMTELGANQQRAPNDVVAPGTFHNSGIMIGGNLPERMRGRPPGSGTHFPSEFEATFPYPGTYTYRCIIHAGFMGGTITVKGVG
ncbi:MAG TPA: hypothetical protein VNE62_08480 [Actinomycetota bacterium]|nr:hypothetical protein [Actinomycetota bacterium]